ncbi:hypothetical protein OIO90_002686 [Microbotryomycetes sp. JL221]|nr:hypothetical protein OIO90_002686 [Microbotryomycetes sp. JL221]
MFEGAGLRLHTLTYKTVDGVDITADVGIPPNPVQDVDKQLPLVPGSTLPAQQQQQTNYERGDMKQRGRPLLLFVHGGGLVAGNKLGWLPAWLMKDAFDKGFIVLSPDYSLLLPCTAHDALQDVKDLWQWIHSQLNPLLSRLGVADKDQVDLDRIVVTGASAGGLLTWWFGYQVEPTPKALAPIYPGGGALIADHYLQTKPPETWLPDKTPRPDRLSQQEVYDIEHSSTRVVRTDVQGSGLRRALYFPLCLGRGDYIDVFTGQQGLSANLRSMSTLEQRQKSIPKQHCKIFPELAKIEKGKFPPTIYVHGLADDGVLIQESRAMKRKLDSAGVECVAVEIPGKGHGFDLIYKDSRECPGLDKVVPFLWKHISN